jgi:hypothetical protein
MGTERYTARLNAGLGLVEETRTLLEIWQPGMSATSLFQAALGSGRFPQMSARRLRNLVAEGFAPRFLSGGAEAAALVKAVLPALSSRDAEQVMFVYACRANVILGDFVREVYWRRYSAGATGITNQDSRQFVLNANRKGRTAAPWSEGTINRVAGYLTGCCADFGMLERGARSARRILPFRAEPNAVAVLAYDLHFAGLGDNAVAGHPDWQWFGLDFAQVMEEFKRLSMRGLFLVQAAGDVVRISWPFNSPVALRDGLAQR